MPNGGVPLHMVLEPKHSSEWVVYCRAATINVYAKDEWHARGSAGTPVLSVDEKEARALVGFLGYWLHQPGCHP